MDTATTKATAINADWISTEDAAMRLGISRRQLDRDRDVVLALQIPGFQFLGRGYNHQSFRILWEFRLLVQQRGRAEAIATITRHMEAIDNERI